MADHPRGGSSSRALRIFLAFVALATVAIGLDPLRPTPRAADAPAHLFSAGRAMATVEAIARAPHPTGSAEHDRVRGLLVERLGSLGLAVEVQERIVVGDEGLPEQHPRPLPEGWIDAVRVKNIVARLPATGNVSRGGRHALLLSAHYDSAGASLGASDDGSGVAIILETLRLLVAMPERDRDVIVLISDAEELGLDGARAFVRGHPAAQEVRVTINLEARGSRGASRMFETTAGDAGWVDRYDRSGARSRADSLSASIYRKMGRDTDLTVLRQAEIAGYNFAFIRGFEHYHTPLDSVDHLDRGTLQEQGEAVLALARSLVVDELPGKTERDAMFFTFAGETWVLSAGMGNALAVLALLLALGTIGQRVSLGAVSAGGMLRAGLLWFGVVGVLGSGVGLFLVVTGIRAWLHDGWSHPSPLTAQAMAVLSALVLLGGSGAVVGWRRFRGIGEGPGPHALARSDFIAAATLALACGTLLLLLALPRASYLGSLPLLGACFVLLGQDERGTRGRLGTVLSLGVLPALALWPVALEGIGVAFGIAAAPAVVLVGILFLPITSPLLATVVPDAFAGRSRVYLLGFAALALGGTMIAVAARPGVPLAASVHHVTDLDRGTAQWVTFDRRPGRFVGGILGVEDPRAVLGTNLVGEEADPVLALAPGHRHDDEERFVHVRGAAPATHVPVTATATEQRRGLGDSGMETVHELMIEVPADARALDLVPEQAWIAVEVRDGIHWRPVADRLERFRLVAPPRSLALRVRTATPEGEEALRFRAIVMRDGLPDGAVPAGLVRGEDEMPSTGDRSFAENVVRP